MVWTSNYIPWLNMNVITYPCPNQNGSPWSPFYWHGLILFPAWKSNHIHYKVWDEITYPLQWHHIQWHDNERNAVSNHWRLDCLLKCLFRHRSSNSALLASVRGIRWWLVDSPHKGPAMQKMSPFDDVIMQFPNFSGATIKVLQWISLIPHFTEPQHVITYPCWD